MRNKIKTLKFNKSIIAIIITCLNCIVLGLIVFNGKYFQNGYKSFYINYIHYIVAGWLLYFLISGVCFNYLLYNVNKKNSCIFLFVLQYVLFAINLVSVYCFDAYLIALISSLFSFILTVYLAVVLFKNNQYRVFVILLLLIILYGFTVFSNSVCCSLEYGIWKN